MKKKEEKKKKKENKKEGREKCALINWKEAE